MAHTPSILIIEDSPELTVLYEKILSPLKCLITKCSTGSSALEFLRAHRPSVIVTDLTLPDMSTEAFFEKFVGISEIETIPLLLISGRDDLSSWQDLFGATYALKKPTDVIKFRDCVRTMLETARPLEL